MAVKEETKIAPEKEKVFQFNHCSTFILPLFLEIQELVSSPLSFLWPCFPNLEVVWIRPQFCLPDLLILAGSFTEVALEMSC